MIIGNIDTEKEIIIVAEIGNNHEGSYTLAEELIGLAKASGAHAVKFQTFKTEHYISRKDERRFKQLKSFELTWNEFERLSHVAQSAGLLFISTPFDLESAEFLRNIISVYKIASGDNDFYPLIEYIASTGLPIIMSGGLTDIAQLQYSSSLIRKIWSDHKIDQSLAVLHCVSSYPVPPDQANLGAIRHIKHALQCTVGYSDHTLGTEAAILSAAMGARIIEKHFTINKNHSTFRDHQLSADPEEMRTIVRKVKDASRMLGSGIKEIQMAEVASKDLMRRSIVAKHDLPKGNVLSWDDITWIRPSGGLAPGKETLILGKMTSVPIAMGEQIQLEHLI